MVKKFKYMLIHFDKMHKCDRHPDGQMDTAQQHRLCLCKVRVS